MVNTVWTKIFRLNTYLEFSIATGLLTGLQFSGHHTHRYKKKILIINENQRAFCQLRIIYKHYDVNRLRLEPANRFRIIF